MTLGYLFHDYNVWLVLVGILFGLTIFNSIVKTFELSSSLFVTQK